MKNKTYYSLLIKDKKTDPWSIHFGDYDRETVDQEKEDVSEDYAKTRIITTGDSQADIYNAVNELNAKEGHTLVLKVIEPVEFTAFDQVVTYDVNQAGEVSRKPRIDPLNNPHSIVRQILDAFAPDNGGTWIKSIAGRFEVSILPNEQRGYFEHDTLGEDKGGGLWFQIDDAGKVVLTDYDGPCVNGIPRAVVTHLRFLGFVIPSDFEIEIDRDKKTFLPCEVSA
jgi:hypothetical protein